MNLYLAHPGEAPVPVKLGKIQLTFDANANVGRAAFESPEFAALPEIEHIFRPDEKEPSKVIPLAVSALLVAPWLAVLGLWASSGWNLKNLFASPSLTLYGFGFLGCLVAWVGLFYLYFTVFNLFDLFKFGSPLSVASIILGRQALVAHSQRK